MVSELDKHFHEHITYLQEHSINKHFHHCPQKLSHHYRFNRT